MMQLIVNMPLLNILFPQNAVMLYTFINNVASFNIIPDSFIQSIKATFGFHPNEGETDPNFQSMGYQSDNIIDNMGSMILYLVGFVMLVAFALSIRFLKNKYAM